MCEVYNFGKENVFRLDLNESREGFCRKGRGRSFHVDGPSFGVGIHVLESVYCCLVESVLSFNIVTWYRNLSVKNRAQLARVINTASKIIGAKQKLLYDLYHFSGCRKSGSILHDKTHPLKKLFQHLLSGQ